MKKVLHRSFKPAKCKTALQMAMARLKTLKNKKDTQIKQLRRELAQLLESGQTQTAKIRVEHVVREEKTLVAYELVGLYCEILVRRLGEIESQKTCPSDLKEAVAGVLYASQRLTDVVELSDIVKQLSAKFGKDFVSAATGLQPDSGVSRLLVEKLSVKAPDGPMKIRILTEIAKEHNVSWEAESLVESDPKETVLVSGASSSHSQASTGIKSESSRIQNNQAPGTFNVSQNSYATDGRSSSRTTSTDHYYQDPKPSGDRTDGREHRHPNPGHGDSSVWETEFVDATSAARAAAESAERASFAARAAAELSRKEKMMNMQNSTESQNSSSYDKLRNNPPHSRSGSSNVQSIAKEEMLRNSNWQEDQSTIRAESTKKTVDELSENASWRRGHSRDNSLEMRREDSFAKDDKQPSAYDVNLGSSDDVLLKKQSSRASSHSPSSNFSDDNDVTVLDHIDSPRILEGNIFQSTVEDIRSHNDYPDVVTPAFDEYSSFFDKPQFDTEDVYCEEPEHGLGFSLLGSGSKSPDHISTETYSWSMEGHKSLEQPTAASTSQVIEKEKPSSLIFDDVPAHDPEPEPVAEFDDDDRESESEEDKLGRFSGHVEEKPKLKSQKSQMSEAPDDLGRYFFPSDTEDQGDDSKTQEESDVETPKGLSFGPLASGLKNEKTPSFYETSPPRDKTSSTSVNEYVPTEVDPLESSYVKEIYTHKASNTDKRPSSIPPDSSSSDDESEIELRERVKPRTQPTHLHSRVSHEDSEERILTGASVRSQERRKTQKTTLPSASASYFHSISSDDEDEKELRRDATRIQTKPTISISRRTKGQVRRSSLVTAKTDNVSYDQESPPRSILEAKPLAKQVLSASYESSLPKTDKGPHYQESPPKPSLEALPLAEQLGSATSSSFLPKTYNASLNQESRPKLVPTAKSVTKQQGSAPSSSSHSKTEKVFHYKEPSPKPTPEAKLLSNQEGSASSSTSLPKTVPAPDPETPVKEKGSHVHPKLPDYDDIFAKLGALRR